MMSKKSPQLRFEGFTDDWEERKWIDTVDMSTNMVNPKTGDYDDLLHIGPGNIESFTGRILDNVNTVKNDNLISGKFHFNPNDIIYGKINPQLAKYVHVDFEGLASADAYVLNSKNGVNQGFLFVELQTSGFYKYSVSVSMRTGMPKINRDELNQFSYLAPKNIEEQQRIGSFFKQLDETIALHQRKLDLLKEQKKGYLQKMFPKNGAKVPELRFAGFADDWEERKAKEMIKTHHFRSYLAEPNDVGNYEVIQQGDKPIAGYANGEPFEYFYDVTLFGDHTVSLFKPTKPFFIATDGVKIISADEFDGRYFYVTLERYKPASQGYKRHFTILKNEDIWFTTNKDEQVKIGTFFKQLDDIITLHQRKLDLLKEQKKGFLQKMFV